MSAERLTKVSWHADMIYRKTGTATHQLKISLVVVVLQIPTSREADIAIAVIAEYAVYGSAIAPQSSAV
jgi:hypothetical protein